MSDPKLGARAEAQQRVLARGCKGHRSWIDVEREIKRETERIIRQRAALSEQSPNTSGKGAG